MAVDRGYTNVFVYKEGLLGWRRAGHRLESVVDYPKVKIPLISSIELRAMNPSSILLLDIRPRSHFNKGHIHGATNLDLEKLHDHTGILPKNKKLVLIDHKGKLTLTTGRFLKSKGFVDVSRLDGGFNAWIKNGFPAEN